MSRKSEMKSQGLLISFITHYYAFLTGDDKMNVLDASLASSRVASFVIKSFP
jgi:hypothetical protein